MILCADDFGLRSDIDEAVLDLVAAGRLSAVSCCVAAPAFSTQAFRLLPAAGRVEIGLHLMLTDEGGADFPPYRSLLTDALLHRIATTTVADRIARQYETFIGLTGKAPDFLDSHLHVHQLPGIRETLVRFILSRSERDRPRYVRNTFVPPAKAFRQGVAVAKNMVIAGPGLRLKRLLLSTGIPTNEGFAGIYDYRQWHRYPEYFRRFAACMEAATGILMIHPGKRENWRRIEYETVKAAHITASTPDSDTCHFQRVSNASRKSCQAPP